MSKPESSAIIIQTNSEDFYRWSLSEWENPNILPEDFFDISEILNIKRYDTSDTHYTRNNIDSQNL